MSDGARWMVTAAVTLERHANDTRRVGPVGSDCVELERALERNRGLQWWMEELIEWSDKHLGN